MRRLAAAALVAVCCGPPSEPTAPLPLAVTADPVADDDVRRFAFTTIDGKQVTSAGYRGRMTVIALVATYDLASQAQARYLNALVQHHVPRVNALLLVLEPEHHKPLVEAYASSLALRYDVALADDATVAGEGPFRGLHHVPSIVLLDRDGREVWRNLGLVDEQTLSSTIARHDDKAHATRP